MKDGKASYTAEVVAGYRAAESSKPEAERACYDPFASHFLRAAYRAVGKSRLVTKAFLWYRVERKYPGSIGEVVGRTRHIDDHLKACIADGIQQLVVLGAGYDSRAYRFGELRGKVKVFEVDHPATQRVKMDKVKTILGRLPEHVVYVPVDFDKQKLGQRLFECGYNRNLKTLFIWEGVTMYITAEAVDETLAFVASHSGEGSSIIFNYAYKSALDGSSKWVEAAASLKELARIGEPFVFGIEEGRIEEFLSQRGFHQVANANSDYFEKAYLQRSNTKMRSCKFLATVSATVQPRKHVDWGLWHLLPTEKLAHA